jgi:hypothetical protein
MPHFGVRLGQQAIALFEARGGNAYVAHALELGGYL